MASKAPRQEMPLQDPIERIQNFSEVALGYTHELALTEAKRCLNCKVPRCISGCPVSVEIPSFISAVAQDDMKEAVKRLKSKTSLPAVCGRVCPQENQCEGLCVVGVRGEPVAIGRLERYVADWEAENLKADIIDITRNNIKIAVIGAGPAGLACAGDLAKLGYDVTVFEALHTAGGVLMYGIPEFRLPKDVVKREIDYIRSLGVKFELNSIVGALYSIDELQNEYGFEAFFIGTGAGLPYFMHVAGENLNGVYSANEFLTRANLMKAFDFPNYATPIKIGNRVAVIGGGNVAMDAARTALRLGAKESFIVYRRSKDELPARKEELEHALEEGVQLKLLVSPVEYLGDDMSSVNQMKLQVYELGEADESGRRKPVCVPDKFEFMDIDTVVVAIGQGPNPILTENTEGLLVSPKGNIIADKDAKTSISNIYAGGDVVTGAATVIKAMGAGKDAANAIHEYFSSLKQ